MSTVKADIIRPVSGTPGDNTSVDVNGCKIYGKDVGLRSIAFGNSMGALNPTGISAEVVHIGFNIFKTPNPSAPNFPQTIAIGAEIVDSSVISGVAQSIFIGQEIGRNLTTGTDNILLGYQSGSALGGTSSNNVMVGSQSGKALTSGNSNVFLGMSAGYTATSGNNNIIIGGGATAATATSSDSITLGNSSHTVIRAAVTSITSLSDARDKTNVEESTYGLDLVNSLKPVTFEWDTRDGAKKGVKDLGFIAQDLKELDDEHLGLVYDENPEKLEASYGRLIPVLVKAIQEMSSEIKSLKEEILILKSK